MGSTNAIRITTWNVNGIRNPFGYQPWRDSRTFPAMFDILEADIVVMQELKIQRKDLRDDMVLIDGWDCFFSLPKHRKGYSGVGIYTRQSVCTPIKAEEGILGVLFPPDSKTSYCELPEGKSIGGYPSLTQLVDIGVDPIALDSEGRCVVLEFPAFVLFGVYSPANSNGMRDDFRHGFLKALDIRIRNLDAMGKRVILTGDLNVSRDPRDSACVEEDLRKMGLSHVDYISSPNRRIFNQLLDGGDVVKPRDAGREQPILSDLCREFYPTRKAMYTHWEQKINARPGNYGSRIDYVLCSISMRPWFVDANIQEGLMGSDHCPVYASIQSPVLLDGKSVDIRDIMNPSGMYEGGKKKRESSSKDLLPFSGKLLAEFDRRRSIKDMFRKQTTFIDENLVSSTVTAASEPTGSDTQLFIPVDSKDSTSQRTDNSAPSPKTQSSEASSNQRSNSSILQSNSSPYKKRKPNPTSKESNAPSNNQKTLKSFFLATQSKSDKTYHPSSTGTGTPSLSKADASPSKTGTRNHDSSLLSNDSPTPNRIMLDSLAQASESDDKALTSPAEEKFIDPEETRMEWTKIFSKRDPPRCEGHNEPCTNLETKKKGVNCGRRFWICPRPVGPSGSKESGTQWRCKTFIWASDVGKNP